MKKEPLVLLPGLLSDDYVWDHQVKYLSEVADIYIPNLSYASSPNEMIEEIMKVAPDSKFAIAGHSMGGWLSLEIVKHYPERVSKLCLLATRIDSDSKEKK
jgi:pimeloyl-ACP methyl ester carboxylesterase